MQKSNTTYWITISMVNISPETWYRWFFLLCFRLVIPSFGAKTDIIVRGHVITERIMRTTLLINKLIKFLSDY